MPLSRKQRHVLRTMCRAGGILQTFLDTAYLVQHPNNIRVPTSHARLYLTLLLGPKVGVVPEWENIHAHNLNILANYLVGYTDFMWAWKCYSLAFEANALFVRPAPEADPGLAICHARDVQEAQNFIDGLGEIAPAPFADSDFTPYPQFCAQIVADIDRVRYYLYPSDRIYTFPAPAIPARQCYAELASCPLYSDNSTKTMLFETPPPPSMAGNPPFDTPSSACLGFIPDSPETILCFAPSDASSAIGELEFHRCSTEEVEWELGMPESGPPRDVPNFRSNFDNGLTGSDVFDDMSPSHVESMEDGSAGTASTWPVVVGIEPSFATNGIILVQLGKETWRAQLTVCVDIGSN